MHIRRERGSQRKIHLRERERESKNRSSKKRLGARISKGFGSPRTVVKVEGGGFDLGGGVMVWVTGERVH